MKNLNIYRNLKIINSFSVKVHSFSKNSIKLIFFFEKQRISRYSYSSYLRDLSGRHMVNRRFFSKYSKIPPVLMVDPY